MPTFGLNVSGMEGKPKLQISVSEKYYSITIKISVDLLLHTLDNGAVIH